MQPGFSFACTWSQNLGFPRAWRNIILCSSGLFANSFVVKYLYKSFHEKSIDASPCDIVLIAHAHNHVLNIRA